MKSLFATLLVLVPAVCSASGYGVNYDIPTIVTYEWYYYSPPTPPSEAELMRREIITENNLQKLRDQLERKARYHEAGQRKVKNHNRFKNAPEAREFHHPGFIQPKLKPNET